MEVKCPHCEKVLSVVQKFEVVSCINSNTTPIKYVRTRKFYKRSLKKDIDAAKSGIIQLHDLGIPNAVIAKQRVFRFLQFVKSLKVKGSVFEKLI